MKKTRFMVAMLLVLVMIAQMIPVYAELGDAEHPVTEIITIQGNETQPTIKATAKEILEIEGLYFKDLNGNKELDVYEDWRQDIDARVLDLYNQMTLKEKTMLLYQVCTCGDNTGVTYDIHTLYEQNCPYGEGNAYSMWYYINEYGITTYLDNSNGTPDEQVWAHNEIQAIGENTRLGVPITFTSDRQYNAWGGMIDTPHDAFGTAGDVELATKLWELYSAETRALGYHVVFHPYGVEIGSWNGEDPAYIAKMTAAEVTAIQNGGMQACTKHFIARGGDTNFEETAGVAMTIENWMEGWEAAIGAGTKWIMTNGYNKGLSMTVNVDYDTVTMDYLRKTLGYDGIVLTDWGAMGNDMSQGIAHDGVDIGKLTLPERYARAINNGVDQMGAPGAGNEEQTLAASGPGLLSVDSVMHAVEQNLISEERLFEAAARILKSKFELGLFENPYSDAQEALALSANIEYITNKWNITTTEELMAARPAEEVEMERQLQAKSAALIKNENDLLPLKADMKVYFDSTAAAATKEAIKGYFAQRTTVVDDMEEADVVVADCTSFNDAAELMVDDAKEYGKKLVVVANCVDPNTWAVENADALLFLNFSRTADHGSGAGVNVVATTEPVVFVELLYGDRQPEGFVVKELPRTDLADSQQWENLAGDQGVSNYVRLMLLGTMKANEDHTTPANWGDPLLGYRYGMRYGEYPKFTYDTLILPRVDKEVETESSGSTSVSVESVVEAKAGVPFTVSFLMWNEGSDGITTVQVKDGETVVGEKIMAIRGGDWRVVEMDITLDTPGAHTINVGTLSGAINIAE